MASSFTVLAAGLVACLLLATQFVVVTATDPVLGVKASSVITLTTSTFQLAIEDAANPLWLLKFYAPWCGHCKKLEPILNSVAGKVTGKLAIGKIDCTKSDSKKLCNDHGVRGYPTLKFSVDGDIYDYPGGRTENEILAFSERLNLPPVQILPTISSVLDFAETKAQDGILFLAYHPQVQGETVDEKTQSTLLTQIYAQVARKGRVFGHYAILDPTTATDIDALGLTTTPTATASTPFVCRIENNVPPRCYEDIESVNMNDLISFVRTHNVPTVAQLGPGNFAKLGRLGKKLVIAAVNGQDVEQIKLAKDKLISYALTGPEAIREKYYYGWFDVNQWAKFLSQFNVIPKDSPQVFILNVPDKTFWQNATYKLNVEDFLAAVEDGTIISSSAGKPKGGGIVDTALYWITDNLPWSVTFVVFAIVAIGVFIAMIVAPGDDLRPPYDMQQQQQQQQPQKQQQQKDQIAASPTKNATATKDDSAAPASKKDD